MAIIADVAERVRIYPTERSFSRLVYHTVPVETLVDITAGTVARQGTLGFLRRNVSRYQDVIRDFTDENERRTQLSILAESAFVKGEEGYDAPKFRKRIEQALNKESADAIKNVEDLGMKYFWDIMRAERKDIQAAYRKVWALLRSDSDLYHFLAAGASRRLIMIEAGSITGEKLGAIGANVIDGIANFFDKPYPILRKSLDDIEDKMKKSGGQGKVEKWKREIFLQFVLEIEKEYRRDEDDVQAYREKAELARELFGQLTQTQFDLRKAEDEKDGLRRRVESLGKDLQEEKEREKIDPSKKIAEESAELRVEKERLIERIRKLKKENADAVDLALNEAGKLYRAVTSREAEYRRLEESLNGSQWDPRFVTAILGRGPELLAATQNGNGPGFTRDRLREAAKVYLDGAEEEIDRYVETFIQLGALIEQDGILSVPDHIGHVQDRHLKRYVSGRNEILSVRT